MTGSMNRRGLLAAGLAGGLLAADQLAPTTALAAPPGPATPEAPAPAGPLTPVTISDLRSSKAKPQAAYYVSDTGREGVFAHRADDSTSADDGATIVVNTDGSRFNRVYEGPASVKWFGAIGDGVVDDTAAIVAALAAPGAALYFPPGTYRITSTIPLKSDLLIRGDKATLQLDMPAAEITRGTGFFYIENLENIRIHGLTFLYGDSLPWAVVVRQGRGITMTDCQTIGAHLFLATLPLGAKYPDMTPENVNRDIVVDGCTARGKSDYQNADGAINIVFTDGWRVSNNSISGYSHGVQWWGGDADPNLDGALANERKTANGIVQGNNVFDLRYGGIWGSMGKHITVVGNTVTGVGDVGIDFEGCFYCTAVGNTVKDAYHGELAIFFLNRDIVFADNTVLKTKPGDVWAARIANSSQLLDNKAVTFNGNTFHCTNGSIAAIGSDAVESILFVNNHLRNVRLSLGMKGVEHNVIGNQVIFDTAATDAFTAVKSGGDINKGMTKIVGNTVKSFVDQPAGSVAIAVAQGDYNSSAQTLIESNITAGFPVDIVVSATSENVGISPRFVVRDNILGSRTFQRDEGTTKKSTVRLESNQGADGRPYPAGIPTSGKWDAGQIVYYPTPEPGGHLGAVCVTTGTPGAWRKCAPIES